MTGPLLGRVALGLLVGGLLLPTAGCMTRAEGDRLAREATDRERRLKALEEGIDEQRAELKADLERGKSKITELGEVLEEATQVVRRNSADLGLEVEQIKEKIAHLEGAIAEARHEVEQLRRALREQRSLLEDKLETFARRAGVDMDVAPGDIPKDKAAHYEAAERALGEGAHSKARALFREYLGRYPKDEHAGNAQYLIGRSYLSQDKPATALAELRKVLSTYRDSDAMDKALFGMGEAFFALQSCSDAKNAFQALIKSHPKSSLVKDARAKLREVQRAPKSQCTK
jgi:tol-pal system protein YbgF